ncbi:hypothetical protein KFE98_01255 [bacterium SCSIO 12741]|nr:hypothetical protein KFE98_01255 [bacterium SCSIO 12741]
MLTWIPLIHKRMEVHAENPRDENFGKDHGTQRVATLEYASGTYNQGVHKPSPLVQDLTLLEKLTSTFDVVPTYFGVPVMPARGSKSGTFQVNVSPKSGTGFNLHAAFEKDERVDYDKDTEKVAPVPLQGLHTRHIAIRKHITQTLLDEFGKSNIVRGDQQKFLATFFMDAATVVSSFYVLGFNESAIAELNSKKGALDKRSGGNTANSAVGKMMIIRRINKQIDTLQDTAKNAFLLFPRFDIQRAAKIIAGQTGAATPVEARKEAFDAFVKAINSAPIPNYPNYPYSDNDPMTVPVLGTLKNQMKTAARQLMIDGSPLIPDRNIGQGPTTPGTILKNTSSSLIPKEQAAEGVYEIRNPFTAPIPLGHWAKAMEQYEAYLASKGVRY